MNLKSLRLLPPKNCTFFRISEHPVKRPVGNLAMPMLQVKWTAEVVPMYLSYNIQRALKSPAFHL